MESKWEGKREGKVEKWRGSREERGNGNVGGGERGKEVGEKVHV